MFTVFDLETTGLSTINDDVIQFAYATFNDNNLLIAADVLYFYYEGMSWSEEAYNVHQISKSFLKQYEDKFEENIIKMWTVLSGANVIGHNVEKFDCPFATNWLAKFGLTGLRFGVIQDTMKAFKPMFNGHGVKLTKLCDTCMINPEAIRQMSSVWFPEENNLQAHNACYDVTATAMATMLGLRKHYISFNMEDVKIDDLSSVDVSLLDKGSSLPMTDKVSFTLIESDGTLTEHQFVSDAEKYNHSTSIIDKDSLSFPRRLTFVDEGLYQYEHDGTLFELRTNKIGDMFKVKTSFAELTTPVLNLRTFTESYVEKEG